MCAGTRSRCGPGLAALHDPSRCRTSARWVSGPADSDLRVESPSDRACAGALSRLGSEEGLVDDVEGRRPATAAAAAAAGRTAGGGAGVGLAIQ